MLAKTKKLKKLKESNFCSAISKATRRKQGRNHTIIIIFIEQNVTQTRSRPLAMKDNSSELLQNGCWGFQKRQEGGKTKKIFDADYDLLKLRPLCIQGNV